MHRRAKGLWRDLLFFITFSITVTSAVKLAGVLIVFSLLVAPALISTTIRKGIPIVNALIIGIFLNMIAISVSYYLDFPTGYTIVFINSFAALIASAFSQNAKSGNTVKC
jgi:zinc/manganese transport system permease protein